MSKHAPSPAALITGGFIAGALAVPLFHQTMLLALVSAGFVEAKPFATTPAAMTGIPQVASLAFWGGLWGVALALVLTRTTGATYWLTALVLGALFPSLVAWFVVAPLKGLPLAAGGDVNRLVTALCVNAAWGLGTAALLRPFARR